MLVKEGLLRKRPSPTDARQDLYSLTEKGLDLIPMILELISWSARHDPRSDARNMKPLVRRIRKDPRAVARKLRSLLRRGRAAFPDLLE
jgi:DNA-binding PadR family transcriptional regulator